MNKSIAYALGVLFGVAGLIGIFWITIERPDASATFTSTFVLLFGLISTYFVTVNGNAKVSDRLEKVETNTNGRLTAKDAEIIELQRKMLAAGIDPQSGQAVTGSTTTTTPKEPQEPRID